MDQATSTAERNDLFQRLKPCCVRISQLAIKEAASPQSARELISLTDQLMETLDKQVERTASALDEKLAEYIFFPLYYIFRQVDQYPTRLVENCVKCLTLLIRHGWKSKLSSQLAQQILVLLTYILDGVPGSGKTKDLAEETALETFRALETLFTTAGTSVDAAAGLTGPETLPALGHGITLILNGVLDGVTPQIQVEAVRAIRAFYMSMKDQEAVASFLPGVISSLTKALSKPSRHRKAVLINSLQTVQLVLTRVLSDMRTRTILTVKNDQQPTPETDNKVLSASWLAATVSQVRLALSSIMKLRTSDEPEVREALKELCITLLDECHTTLSSCAAILVETALALDDGTSHASMTETTLTDLVSIYPELSDMVKDTLDKWMAALPHTMRVSDESVKSIALRNVSKGLALSKHLNISGSTFDDLMYTSLRDSITSLVLDVGSQETSHIPQIQLLSEANQEVVSSEVHQFQPVLMAHDSQRRVRNAVMALVHTIAASPQQSSIANKLLEDIRKYVTDNQSSDHHVAAFWLCFQLIKSVFEKTAEEESFLDLSAFSDTPGTTDGIFSSLYEAAVEVLALHTDLTPLDWRFEAIALEVIAYAGQRSGMDFRPELIDILFPITTFLGSDNPVLQHHAISALNSLSVSCQYGSVSELIIDNADYMINSISLRFNAANVSPASTKVLQMVIKLAGPAVVPFLDDIVEFIFSALESYHGNSAFVASLFSVLQETVKQGVRSDALLLKGQDHTNVDHRKPSRNPEGLQYLREYINKQQARKAQQAAEEDQDETNRGHPEQPWKHASAAADDTDEQEETENGQVANRDEQKPPNTPTYQLLERITALSQYYLTSSVPELRRTLLELISTSSEALAHDEDTFLPLVNAIWPVVIGCLRDAETYVAIEACHTLSKLCAAAGDFLSSRWKTEWSEGLGNWCRQVKRQAVHSPAPMRPSRAKEGRNILIPTQSGKELEIKPVSSHQSVTTGSLGQHASASKMWEALVKLLTALISFVQVDEVVFDEILDLLMEVMEQDAEVRRALETINADAVWLLRYERGLVEELPTPKIAGFNFIAMKS
ncbi:hypothetical protein S7711_09601 [Stachybotrys chartarum IBT 7711]|uniref:HEAT repeat protein n=1 Tax=Stachybotrys chartarum (strain CBS 109288 / IBT 7711) TaxID=1280523 RepID=A0A084AGA6_STACB|nr:hypothetical protein S7711_09601 [Stachybotrys chartarum IBT 7711]